VVEALISGGQEHTAAWIERLLTSVHRGLGPPGALDDTARAFTQTLLARILQGDLGEGIAVEQAAALCVQMRRDLVGWCDLLPAMAKRLGPERFAEIDQALWWLDTELDRHRPRGWHRLPGRRGRPAQ
jgi:hypothetical protein